MVTFYDVVTFQEARLLWLQGHRQPALHAVKRLIQDMSSLMMVKAEGEEERKDRTRGRGRRGIIPGAAGDGVDLIQLAGALSLAGKWMSEVQQAGGSTAVLEYLKRAASCLSPDHEVGSLAPHGTSDGGGSGSRSKADSERVSCKVLYRLASYADQRYREICIQRSSPEFIHQV